MAPSFLAWVDQHDLALAPAFLLSIFCPSELPHLILLHLQAPCTHYSLTCHADPFLRGSSHLPLKLSSGTTPSRKSSDLGWRRRLFWLSSRDLWLRAGLNT